MLTWLENLFKETYSSKSQWDHLEVWKYLLLNCIHSRKKSKTERNKESKNSNIFLFDLRPQSLVWFESGFTGSSHVISNAWISDSMTSWTFTSPMLFMTYILLCVIRQRIVADIMGPTFYFKVCYYFSYIWFEMIWPVPVWD